MKVKLPFVALGAFAVSLALTIPAVANIAPVPSRAQPWIGQLPRDRPIFDLPIAKPVRVLKYFAPPQSRYGRGNRGVDFATSEGTQVFAPAAGTVAYVGTIDGMPIFSIQHASGIRTTYQPLVSDLSVGDVITAGELIGEVGSGRDGNLHWGAKLSQRVYIDPLQLLITPVFLKG